VAALACTRRHAQRRSLTRGAACGACFVARVRAALGLSAPLFGQRLLPIGTLYDPFISRGLDALNYACYQDARFLLVATPSGITLAPEGGAHQSIYTPSIGMGQPNLTYYEPAYADELAVTMREAFGASLVSFPGGAPGRPRQLSRRRAVDCSRHNFRTDAEASVGGRQLGVPAPVDAAARAAGAHHDERAAAGHHQRARRHDVSRRIQSARVNDAVSTARPFVCARAPGRLLDGGADRDDAGGGRVLRRGGARRFALAADRAP